MNIADLIRGKTQIKCPRCRGKLNRSRLRKTYVNRCSRGCGVWIDQHQLDQLAGTKSKRYEVANDLPIRPFEKSELIQAN